MCVVNIFAVSQAALCLFPWRQPGLFTLILRLNDDIYVSSNLVVRAFN